MSDPFVAEIRIFAFNFPPTGWAFCDGQILPISQNTALFSLLGTTYGGNGQSTFALPDLQGSTPLMWGQGAGLALYDLGQQAGEETVTLLQSEMPLHTHNLMASNEDGTQGSLTDGIALASSVGGTLYTTVTNANLTNMAFQGLPPAGGSLPHNNMMPYLTLNFCIALQGIFPPRT
jgi:microcystin-dependent protein